MEKLLAIIIIEVVVLGSVVIRLLDPFARAILENIGGVILRIAGYLRSRKLGWLR